MLIPLIALQTLITPPPVAPSDPAGGLVAAEVGRDYSWLIASKEKHDAVWGAVVLPWAVRALPQECWFLELGYDYKLGTDTPKSARPATSSGSGAASFAIDARAPVSDGYPNFITGTIKWQRDDRQISLDWSEPMLQFKAPGLCLYPRAADITVRGGEYNWTERFLGSSDGSVKGPVGWPVFQCPENIYHIFECWLIDRAVLSTLSADAGPSSWATTLHRTVTTKAGQGEHRLVLINQQDFDAEHRTFYTIKRWMKDSTGNVKETEETINRTLKLLEGGRQIVIDCAGTGAACVPTSAKMSADGVPTLVARYGEAGNSPASDRQYRLDMAEVLARQHALFAAVDRKDRLFVPELYGPEKKAAIDGLLARERLTHDALAAAWLRDRERLAEVMRQWKDRLKADGVPDRYHVYNLEALLEWSAEHVDLDESLSGVLPLLCQSWGEQSAEDGADHLARLISQSRLGLARLLASDLSQRTDAPDSTRDWAAQVGETLRTDSITSASQPMNASNFILVRRVNEAIGDGIAKGRWPKEEPK